MPGFNHRDISQLNDIPSKKLAVTRFQLSTVKCKDVITDYDTELFCQRHADIWTKKKKVKFVADILQGKACPPIEAILAPDETHYIIDGKQRVTTLKEALDHPELSRQQKTILKNYPLTVATEYMNEKDWKVKVAEKFEAYNQGDKLTTHDIRRAKELAARTPYMLFTVKEVRSMRFKRLLKLFSDEINEPEKFQANYKSLEKKNNHEILLLKILVVYYRTDFSKEWKWDTEIDRVLPTKTQKELSEAFQRCYEVFNIMYGGGKDIMPLCERTIGQNASFSIPAIMGILAHENRNALRAKQNKIKAFLADVWTMSDTQLRDAYNLQLTGGSGGSNKAKFDLIHKQIRSLSVKMAS